MHAVHAARHDGQRESPMTDHEPGVFWSWSLERYQRPGVEDLLLRLQDSFACNVNMLLWLCWTAEQYAPASDIVIRKAASLVSDWNAGVTENLRAARRVLKQSGLGDADISALRNAIKDAELTAERIEQRTLEKLARSALPPTDNKAGDEILSTARRNLAAYAALSGAVRKDGFSTSLLHDLIDNIFPATNPVLTEKACAHE